MTKRLLIYCTCPDTETAQRIARALVSGRLAACVNRIGPVSSVYEWDGNIQEDEEHLLVIKTTETRLEALTARISELHPYELPEIVAVPITAGSKAYLEWIDANTA